VSKSTGVFLFGPLVRFGCCENMFASARDFRAKGWSWVMFKSAGKQGYVHQRCIFLCPPSVRSGATTMASTRTFFSPLLSVARYVGPTRPRSTGPPALQSAHSSRNLILLSRAPTECLLRSSTLPARQEFRARFFATRAELAAARAAAAGGSGMRVQIEELFTRIQKACEEGGMAEKNAGFKVVRESPTKLVVDLGSASNHVVLTLEADGGWSGVSMTSSKQAGARGAMHYKYNPITGHWTSETDKHFLIELLTRDMVYHCKGYPAF
jgi:hypothetical protein